MRELFNRVFKKEEGFSLIELIIVIAILAIIAAIAVPNLIGNIERANKSTDESNAKLIHDSINIAIGLNPSLEGQYTGTTELQFVDDGTSNGDPQQIINEATGEFPGGVPLPKFSGNGAYFTVEITSSGVSVFNESGTGVDTDVRLYP